MGTTIGVLVAPDHWVDPGGRTLEALEEFLSERTGRHVRVEDVKLFKGIDDLREVIFGSLQ